jgi:hypothetical protein
MARPKKPYKPNPKPKTFHATTATFPSLHPDVANALRHDLIFSAPWFNQAGNDRDAVEDYLTNIMGKFECRNSSCPQRGWGSKKIGILIRRFADNGYDAVVFKQRCKSCERIGAMRIDEGSYVDRVVYRLRKWAGVSVARPEYKGEGTGPAHEERLCEGCKRGYCVRR